MAESAAERRAREARAITDAAMNRTSTTITTGAHNQAVNQGAKADAIRRLTHELNDLEQQHESWASYVGGLKGAHDPEDAARLADLAAKIVDRRDILQRVRAWNPSDRDGHPYTSGRDVIQGVEHVREIEEARAARASVSSPQAVAPSGPTGPPAPPSIGTAASPTATTSNAAATPAHEGPVVAPSAATPSSAAPSRGAAATDANPDGKYGIPGGAQVWAAPDGAWYVVYTVPGTGTPLAWRIEDANDRAKIFGGSPQHPDRTLTADQWKRSGVLVFGSSRLLANTNEHPFDGMVANLDIEATTQPWLKDPEVLALTAKTLLEGRQPTPAELAGTSWFQSHSVAERNWLYQVASDPTGAHQKIVDGYTTVRGLMIAAGVRNPPEQLVHLIGDRLTAGTWSQQFVQTQIAKLGDPYAVGQLDATLKQWVDDLGAAAGPVSSLAGDVAKARQLVTRWLGPSIASGYNQDQLEQWAGEMRNDPNAQARIEAQLSKQRLGMFPGNDDPTMTYDDIAAPWRAVVQNIWGQPLDETDPLFDRVLSLGTSLGTADQPGGRAGVETLLRQEGVKRGVGTVVNQALSTLGQAFGGSQRRTL